MEYLLIIALAPVMDWSIWSYIDPDAGRPFERYRREPLLLPRIFIFAMTGVSAAAIGKHGLGDDPGAVIFVLGLLLGYCLMIGRGLWKLLKERSGTRREDRRPRDPNGCAPNDRP